MQAAASNEVSTNHSAQASKSLAGAGQSPGTARERAALSALADHQLAQLVHVLRLLGPDQLTAVFRLLDPNIMQPALGEYFKHVNSSRQQPAPLHEESKSPSPISVGNDTQATNSIQPQAPAAPLAPVQPTTETGARAQFGTKSNGTAPQAQPRSIAEAMAQSAARNAAPAAPQPTQSLPQAATPVNNDKLATRPAAKAANGYSRRVSPRAISSSNARIVAKGDRRGIDCKILDVSETGALLRVDKDLTIAENFLLYDFGEKRPDNVIARMPHKSCEVVWRKRNKMGVRFIG